MSDDRVKQRHDLMLRWAKEDDDVMFWGPMRFLSIPALNAGVVACVCKSLIGISQCASLLCGLAAMALLMVFTAWRLIVESRERRERRDREWEEMERAAILPSPDDARKAVEQADRGELRSHEEVFGDLKRRKG